MNGAGSAEVARRLLWSRLDRPPARPSVWFWFVPVVYRGAVVVSVALAVLAGLASVRAVHAARVARQEVCAARLDAWKARNPALAAALRPQGDVCADLERLLASGKARPGWDPVESFIVGGGRLDRRR